MSKRRESFYLPILIPGFIIGAVFAVPYIHSQLTFANSELTMEWGVWESVAVGTTTDTWIRYGFQQEYENPRLVVSTEYNYTGTTENSIQAEVRNVTATSSEVRCRIVSESGSNTNPSSCNVHFVVAEDTGTATNFVIPGTSIEIQAGSVSTSEADWNAAIDVSANVTLYPSFTGNPVAFSTRVTHNDADWYSTWQTDSGSDTDPIDATDGTAHISLYGAQVSTEDPSSAETIHYIILNQESDTATGNIDTPVDATLTGDTVRGIDNAINGYSITISGFSSSPQVALVAQQAMDGGEGGWAHLKRVVNSTSVSVWSLEDQAGDSERSHTTEQVAVLAFQTTGAHPKNIDPTAINSSKIIIDQSRIIID